MSVTVIIPTVGRRYESLEALYDSLQPQLEPLDQLIVMGDGGSSVLWPDDMECSVFCETAQETLGAFGHGIRNLVLDGLREETYCWSIDDDDGAVPGALDAIREAIYEHPGRWFVFQMIGGANSHFPGQKVPTMGHEIRPGNVGTPCIVWPASAKARFGTGPSLNLFPELDRGAGYFGDYEMAVALQEELGDPVWVDTVIAEIRP